MGIYLSTPKTEKASEDGENDKLRFGLSSMQGWIYDHFPTVASSIIVKDYHERKPCACRWKSRKALLVSTYPKRLDRLMSNVVC